MPTDNGSASAGDCPAPVDRTFSGPEAAQLAGISYRQLDYWARRKWIVPSTPCTDDARRVYAVADVVRLAALGHLGRSRVDVATYAEATGRLPVPQEASFVVVWSVHNETVRLVRSGDVRRITSRPGRYVLFDPAPLLRTLGRQGGEGGRERPRRRSFSADYKLRILDQYDRLTEPGTKGALLRAEGLHTSHLVAWRRSRDAGELSARPDASLAAAAS